MFEIPKKEVNRWWKKLKRIPGKKPTQTKK
jgi:hypothetical protein